MKVAMANGVDDVNLPNQGYVVEYAIGGGFYKSCFGSPLYAFGPCYRDTKGPVVRPVSAV